MSKIKTNICSICNFKDVETHLHHILPKSKGGNDNTRNLIEVCISCHRKIHNVQISSENGLIKSGMVEVKEDFEKCKHFILINEYSLMLFMEDFFNEYNTEVLHEMLRFGVLDCNHLVRMFKKEPVKKYFGDITQMVNLLYCKNSKKYNFVF